VVKTPATTTCSGQSCNNPLRKENKDTEEDELLGDPGNKDAEVARL